jgi:xanthine dehydrogenase YagR molybdenum-binding subunit
MTTGREAAQGAAKGAVAPGPDSWAPGSRPDPLARRENGLVGAPVSRVDGAFKVRGAAAFAGEVAMPGMVYAALAFSTVAKGRIVRLDTSAAEGAPGVILVMTYRNAPRMKTIPAFLSGAGKGAMGDEIPVMQDNRIRWNGQPIALVLAETQEQADHAASLIEASYEAEAALTSFAEAKAQFDERTGRIINPSLAECHVPVHADVPEIEVMWTDIPDPHTPMGAHGIGEIGITGVGAAVANAVYNATGRRVRDLPITPDKLL